MRVLQLISSSGYFGAENVLVHLAKALVHREHIHVAAGVIKNLATPHLEIIDECKKEGIATVVFPCRGKIDFNTVHLVRKYILDNKVDIIHSHGYKSNIYSFLSSIGISVKIVATCHNWLGDDPKMRFYTFLDKILLRRFSFVVPVSTVILDILLQSKVRQEKVGLIHNGIELDRFSKQISSAHLRNELGISEDRVVVGAVGRISSEKGHVHLLNIVEELEKDWPSLTVLIVGDGDLRQDLQQKFNRENIVFTGIRNDLPEVYNSMDIFVLPSLTEGLPMVLLEAMASSLPVVVTDVGEISQVVQEKTTGYIVKAGDEPAMKHALGKLLSDAANRKRMGEEGRVRVKDKYSSSQMAQGYLTVYRHCVVER
jgi:glycosyltransferase involved in cell wall biosynthesis